MTGRHEEKRTDEGRKLVETEPLAATLHHPDEERLEAFPGTDRSAPSRPAGVSNAPNANSSEAGPLFAGEEGGRFRQRWDAIQASFVDEPREAVEQAAKLVVEVMTCLEQTFAAERSRLENAGNGGDPKSTEDLRQALRRYRAFFDRLLAI